MKYRMSLHQAVSLTEFGHSLHTDLALFNCWGEGESCSVVSNSLWPHGLYSPWNSPGQNTGVGSLSLLQGIFPTQVSCIAGGFFISWATREALTYLELTQMQIIVFKKKKGWWPGLSVQYKWINHISLTHHAVMYFSSTRNIFFSMVLLLLRKLF